MAVKRTSQLSFAEALMSSKAGVNAQLDRLLELVKWYRQLIAARAHSPIRQLHERMEQAREVAPGFVGIWEAATQQARETMAAA